MNPKKRPHHEIYLQALQGMTPEQRLAKAFELGEMGEDVVLSKLRWARPKDIEDIRDVMAVKGVDALDWNYLNHWTAVHGTSAKLDEIRASIPSLD